MIFSQSENVSSNQKIIFFPSENDIFPTKIIFFLFENYLFSIGKLSFFLLENDLICSLDPGHGVELSHWGGEHKDRDQQQGVSQCQSGQPRL
jgi:hypothetical protein